MESKHQQISFVLADGRIAVCTWTENGISVLYSPGKQVPEETVQEAARRVFYGKPDRSSGASGQ